ncbi:hypothetical protein Smp_188010 [Schistosoma mansoni]|uniref:hypothetical protein n=1 Tax=Schistosoma mansoni TaxID=6183 RepID=UPI00022DC5B8|nr:hypothetical protein Smp_188010 [Schistosoma mansoni]|eukprot:XP_018653452.1 hypothetical protein Smp_188010 [Schistosoma mansoni]
MECYLETNKAHDIRHERDHPLSDLIESMKDVLSPSLCASGYGPVGHLLTRWLPQRNFCELLIGSNESPGKINNIGTIYLFLG